MIFVTVGTQKFPFTRLIRTMDGLAGRGVLGEDVCMQIGTSEWTPRHCSFDKYYPKDVMAQKIRDCSLLVTHSGVGTIVSACTAGKRVLVVPRLKEYGEHVDDNQLEIANAFEAKGMVVVCHDIHNLADDIEKARTRELKPYVPQKGQIENLILDFIEKTEEEES